MAQFDVTASQLQVVKQKIQSKYARIELLNKNFQVVDNLEGVCIGGSISIDANSDMRRSGSIQLVVKDSSFEVQAGGKIFLDKYVRVYIGIYSILEDTIIYTNCGIFLIDAPSYAYEATSHTLNLSLLDLMAELTGARNGYLVGVPTKIEAGYNIREVMISTLELGGFTKYLIDDSGELPIELEFGQGSTVYNILAGLRDIYPNYEIYFDVNGVFHYNQIPTGENEPIQIDDTLWDKIILSENTDIDFQNVKNSIEVYGRTHNPAHYATNVSISGSNIVLTIADVTDYTDGVIYGFSISTPTSIDSPSLCIGDLDLERLYDEDGDLENLTSTRDDEYFCVRWNATENKWYYLGHLQAYAIAEDTNPDSPFYIQSDVGTIRLPLYGGDFDNILSDNLAKQRAQYELWSRTQLRTTVSLSCITVEWLEVNTLVSYTKQEESTPTQWIIKSINYGLDPTQPMSVQLSKFYPNYFYI